MLNFSGQDRTQNKVLEEEDVIEDFSQPLQQHEAKNRFLIAKYTIIGYFILIGLTGVIKLIRPSGDVSGMIGILEKLGYVIATIVGFYFTKN